MLTVCSKNTIIAGNNYNDEIDSFLSNADIIFPIISPSYIASNLCDTELDLAMKKQERNEALVVPIMYRPIHGYEVLIKDMPRLPQAVHSNNKKKIFARDWSPISEAIKLIAEGIECKVKDCLTKICLEEGDKYYEKKNYDGALEVYKYLTELDANNIHGYEKQGNIFLALERYQEALDAYKIAIALSTHAESSAAYCGQGHALLALQIPEDALQAYEQAIQIDLHLVSAHSGRGQAFLAMHRYPEALEAFDKTLQQDSQFPDAYVGKGKALTELQRYKDAIKSFRHATKLSPLNCYVYHLLADALEHEGERQEAVSVRHKITELEPDNAINFSKLGAALLVNHEPEAALSAFNKALLLDYRYLETYGGKGKALYELQRYNEALIFYEEQATRVDPRNAEHYYYLALIKKHTGDSDAALKFLETALDFLKKEPDKMDNHLLAAIYGCKGDIYTNRNRDIKACENYRQASRLAPHIPINFVKLAETLERLSSKEERPGVYIEEILGAYASAKKIEPHDADIHSKEGAFLLKQGKVRDACDCFKKALQFDENYIVRYLDLVDPLEKLNLFEEMRIIFKKAAEVDSNNTYVHAKLGDACYHLGRYKEAHEAYQHALRLDMTNARAHTGYGDVLFVQGRLEDALNEYKQSLQLQDDAVAYNGYGHTLSKQNKHQDALQAYDHAVLRNPNHAPYQHNKGCEFLYLGDYQNALEAFDQAIKLNPSHIETYRRKADALRLQNHFQEALTVYKQALDINPKNELLYCDRASMFYRLGKLKAGLEDFQRALTLNRNLKIANTYRLLMLFTLLLLKGGKVMNNFLLYIKSSLLEA